MYSPHETPNFLGVCAKEYQSVFCSRIQNRPGPIVGAHGDSVQVIALSIPKGQRTGIAKKYLSFSKWYVAQFTRLLA